MGASVWDKEGVVEELKKLVGERLSSSRIAAALSFKYNVNLSRNAVISKVWRIGMSGSLERPRTPSQRKKPDIKPGSRWHEAPPKKQSPLRRALEMAPQPLPVFEPEIVVDPKKRVGIEGLSKHQCRWPIGDPQEPDFHFCDRKQIGGISYCEVHARRAYQPPKLRGTPSPFRPYIPASKINEDA